MSSHGRFVDSHEFLDRISGQPGILDWISGQPRIRAQSWLASEGPGFMPTANKVSADDRVTAYLARHPLWRTPLENARAILVSSELEETIKWGGPAYTLDGRVLVGLAGFKKHCAIWFHQGVYLEDTENLLQNAQKTTRGMRQWRIEAGDKLPKAVFKRYVKETIANERAGMRVTPKRKKSVQMPQALATALKKDKDFATAYRALTPGRQREYAEHVASAKREQTRATRLEKIRPKVLAGEGLNDQYR